MRQSVCYVEPSLALAGEKNTWRFAFTPSTALPKGTLLRFDTGSKGRPIDWEVPKASLKKPANVIYLRLPNGKVVEGKAVTIPNSFVPQFQFILPSEVKAGDAITIVMGALKGNPVTNGNTAQLTLQRRRPFYLFIDPTGKGTFQEPELLHIDVKGNTLAAIRVLAPSFSIKNRRFDIVLRFEDAYGNLTDNAPDNTLIEISHENLRENLKWKVFVPETGFITLPNLYFNETGVYTITLTNRATKEIFRSSPIKCFAEETPPLFWGLLHGESERFDSTHDIESCLRQMRDERSLAFYSTSPYENAEETSNEAWKLISQNVEEFDEDDRFSSFLGFQWCGESKGEGLRHFLYAKHQRPIQRKKEQRSSTLSTLYRTSSPKELISIPSLTMGVPFDFNAFDPIHERVVEIYNAWGSSECTAKEGNLRPIKGKGKGSMSEVAAGSVMGALLRNKRFGFVAGGLDDRGVYAPLYNSDQQQYSPGLTAVCAEDLSREALFDALYNRRCYATTGERILLGLTIAGHPMGSELNTEKKPGLYVNRHIAGFAAGTAPLKKVELIRNGKVLTTFPPKGNAIDFTYDDMEPLPSIALESKGTPFAFYYLRVTQADGHMAWSSPIWVDFVNCPALKGLAPKSAPPKRPKAR